jgi:hypothetical protein
MDPTTMELALWGHGWLGSGTGLRDHKPQVVVYLVSVRMALCNRVTVT